MGLGKLEESGLPYKIYSAILSQSGTSAPSVTLVKNELGGTVVWTRDSIGSYYGTLNAAFTSNKTIILNSSSPRGAGAQIEVIPDTINRLLVATYTVTVSEIVPTSLVAAPADGILQQFHIEVHVYS